MPHGYRWMLILSLAAAMEAATLSIPVANGPLTVDGRPNETTWNSASVLPLQPAAFGAPFPEGGEMRVMLREGYLYLSASAPETGRVTARSTGRNPEWWREDLITWTLRYHARSKKNVFLTVAVNPLGAVRVDSTDLAGVPKGIVAAATVEPGRWSVEVAIPADALAPVGFLTIERVRVPRPDAPELRWYWPGVNDRTAFALNLPPGTATPPEVVAKDWTRRAAPGAAPGETFHALAARLGAGDDARTMWQKSLRARVDTAVESEKRDWEQVASVAAWEKFRDRRLSALKASLGAFPERTPLHASVTRRLEFGDGFAIENVLFESRPGLVVTGNLYLPAKITGRIPAIVVVHAHHAPKVQLELQDMGMTWARAGSAVLVLDQLGAGERLQTQPWARESYYSRYALGAQLYLIGDSLMKWMVWDQMRAIDMLLERPFIDGGRIAVMGS
ncbi:MAG: hypothetical protein NTY38_14030, partial [Acidobacteria bacterium]|nr:hypothetical protein [Acidobacteriota bacterium]